MKDYSRAIRRHHVQRLKAKRKGYYAQYRVYGEEGITHMTPNRLGQVVNTAANCSCPVCGNPRKHFGAITRKEQLQRFELLSYNHVTAGTLEIGNTLT